MGIGDGVKIDGQGQIGHRLVIGDHTVICSCVDILGALESASIAFSLRVSA